MTRPSGLFIGAASLLAACGATVPPSEGAPPRSHAECEVPPPLICLAAIEEVQPPELLNIPIEDVAPLVPMGAAQMPSATREAYDVQRSKTMVDLQPWRVERAFAEGMTLVDLHPRFHRSLLLNVEGETWHLENRSPETVLVDLEQSDASGLALIHLGDDQVSRCAPWSGTPSPLKQARTSGRPYVPICDDHLLVRNTVPGRRSTLEWAADFVRSNVVGGEHITSLVKQTTHDRFRKVASVDDGEAGGVTALGPAPVGLATTSVHPVVSRKDLGLVVDAPAKVPAGAWLEVKGHPGIYTALIAPALVELPPDAENRARVASTDKIEGGALAMLMGFDLASFDLEFEVGTEHPSVGWSPRAAQTQVDSSLPGPDGIGTLAPLGLAAQVPPLEALRLAASFTGGFKREHGAFKEGDLATRRGASHYGVIQDGLIHSKLQPGLATLVVWAGNTTQIVTWTEEMDGELERVLHARQNGVPLLREVDGQGVVSPLIANWRQGNWSGSATGEARTIRAGACIQESERGRFLIYGYFTAATPKTMAKVFLAAGCVDAIHLDMNALEHTYAAVYDRGADGGWMVQHLDPGMAVLDKRNKNGVVLPRFVAFADNRDFFTLLRK